MSMERDGSRTRICRPVVGYQGGKRRLLPRLKPLFPIASMTHYVEPFVGMGALYLDLRGRGYRRPAVLADSHPQVADFWRLLHEDPDALVDAMRRVGEQPATAERYYAMLGEKTCDRADLVGRFLWLTNYAFGNSPNVYDDGWSRTVGTKLTSAAKWGKTFPWDACIDRAVVAAAAVYGTDVIVLSDAADAVARTTAASHTFADPPYEKTRRYTGTAGTGHIGTVSAARGFVALSESPGVAEQMHGWEMSTGDVVARMTGRGVGASGKRAEALFTRTATALFEDAA